MTLDRIVDRAITAKGLEVDARLRKHITDTARASLLRMERKGALRRILDAPDTWWDLVG